MLTNKGPWSQSSQFADMNVMSPDGKQIAYVWEVDGSKAELRTIRTDGAGVRVLTSLSNEGWIRPCAWSKDGKFIAAVIERWTIDQTTRIVTVNLSDGAIRVLKTLDNGGRYRHDKMALSPDGRYLVYSNPASKGRTDRDLLVIDIASGQDSSLLATAEEEVVLGWSPDGRNLLLSGQRGASTLAFLLPMREGKADGPPVPLNHSPGSIWPMGFASPGAFYYATRNANPNVPYSSVEVFIVGVDGSSGKVSGTPRRRRRIHRAEQRSALVS